jgi:hypothetical protein
MLTSRATQDFRTRARLNNQTHVRVLVAKRVPPRIKAIRSCVAKRLATNRPIRRMFWPRTDREPSLTLANSP